MRDTYCSFSLEFLFEVYGITNTEVSISVMAFNTVGQSEGDNWATDI